MVQIHVPVKMGVHHFRRHGVHGFFNKLIDLYMGHGIQPHIRKGSEMDRFYPQQGIGPAGLLLLLRQDLRQAGSFRYWAVQPSVTMSTWTSCPHLRVLP